MDKLGEITIHVVGQVGNEPLGPFNYDISALKEMLEDVESLLYPNEKRNRPIISYEMQAGSVKHVFKTSLQKVTEFSAVLAMITASGNLDGLIPETAKAFEHIQNQSRQKGYLVSFSTSLQKANALEFTPETNYVRTEQIWADAEFYFYGKLTDAGGKNKANIHLDTKEYGFLYIGVDKEYLEKLEGNPLYKEFGVRAIGKQNVITGEMDFTTLRLVEMIDYNRKFNDQYIDNLIKNATPKFRGLDVDLWIKEMSGEDVYD
jgi:hypothetical protein